MLCIPFVALALWDERNEENPACKKLLQLLYPKRYLLAILLKYAVCNYGLPYVIGQTIIFLPCDFFLSIFFFFFFLASQRSEIECLPYFYTWCGLSANLECRSETCCTRLAANTGRKNVAKNRHLGTIAQLCRTTSSQLRHISTIGKKLVKQQYLLHMSLQYDELRPTIGWDPFVSLGHPCKFQRVSRLGSVTARHLVVGVSQTLPRWTEGATYVRQSDHHVVHRPTF